MLLILAPVASAMALRTVSADVVGTAVVAAAAGAAAWMWWRC